MAKKSKPTDSQISEVMRAMVNKRWRKTTKEERSEIARKTVNYRWNKRNNANQKGDNE